MNVVKDLFPKLSEFSSRSLAMDEFIWRSPFGIANMPIVHRGGMFDHPVNDCMVNRNSKPNMGLQSTLVGPEQIFEALDGIFSASIALAFANCTGFRDHLFQCFVVELTFPFQLSERLPQRLIGWRPLDPTCIQPSCTHIL